MYIYIWFKVQVLGFRDMACYAIKDNQMEQNMDN